MKQSHYNTAMTVIRYSVLSFAAFISLFPFIWMLIAATNSNVAINSGSMMIGSELGNNLTKLFNPELGFTKAIFNSAIIALITTFFALLISSPLLLVMALRFLSPKSVILFLAFY